MRTRADGKTFSLSLPPSPSPLLPISSFLCGRHSFLWVYSNERFGGALLGIRRGL